MCVFFLLEILTGYFAYNRYTSFSLCKTTTKRQIYLGMFSHLNVSVECCGARLFVNVSLSKKSFSINILLEYNDTCCVYSKHSSLSLSTVSLFLSPHSHRKNHARVAIVAYEFRFFRHNATDPDFTVNQSVNFNQRASWFGEFPSKRGKKPK